MHIPARTIKAYFESDLGVRLAFLDGEGVAQECLVERLVWKRALIALALLLVEHALWRSMVPAPEQAPVLTSEPDGGVWALSNQVARGNIPGWKRAFGTRWENDREKPDCAKYFHRSASHTSIGLRHDVAIEIYLDGLKLTPDAIVALRRRLHGQPEVKELGISVAGLDLAPTVRPTGLIRAVRTLSAASSERTVDEMLAEPVSEADRECPGLLHDIGFAAFQEEDYSQAWRWFLRAAKAHEAQNDRDSAVRSYLLAAESLRPLGRVGDVVKVANVIIAIGTRGLQPATLARRQSVAGQLLQEYGQFDLAYRILGEAILRFGESDYRTTSDEVNLGNTSKRQSWVTIFLEPKREWKHDGVKPLQTIADEQTKAGYAQPAANTLSTLVFWHWRNKTNKGLKFIDDHREQLKLATTVNRIVALSAEGHLWLEKGSEHHGKAASCFETVLNKFKESELRPACVRHSPVAPAFYVDGLYFKLTGKNPPARVQPLDVSPADLKTLEALGRVS